MKGIPVPKLTILLAVASLLLVCAHAAGHDDPGANQGAVNDAVRPVMEKSKVPGMAVAVTVGGKRCFFNYGVASRKSALAVTEDTIFEIGVH